MQAETQITESQCSSEEEEHGQKVKKTRKARKYVIGDPNGKRVNLKRIVINVSDTQYPVVSEVAEQLQWKIQTRADKTGWDVWWTDGMIYPDVLYRMSFYQKINHYPGIHMLARKNLLGLNLMAMKQSYREEYDFFPMTWLLPSQYPQFRQYFQNKSKGKTRTYIVKPQADCQGRGIFLTRSIQELANGRHYVVQRYVTKPFLIDGLKFDMRVYVLLAGTDPLRVYLYNEGLARFATEKYEQPNQQNMQNMCMHLTNYAINKHNPKFIFNTSTKDMNVGHKRSLTSVMKYLENEGYNVGQIKNKIKDVVIKAFISGIPLVSHQYRYCQPEEYSGNMCFHILGFDIMLTNDLRPILLEVNHTPSFTTDTPLDRLIKHNLIKDTLVLLNITLDKKQQLYTKTVQINELRLQTGKRKIARGNDKCLEVDKAQKERDQFQKSHMGGFQRIHPIQNEQLMLKYKKLLEHSQLLFHDQSSLRGKLLRQQTSQLANKSTTMSINIQSVIENPNLVTSSTIEGNNQSKIRKKQSKIVMEGNLLQQLSRPRSSYLSSQNVRSKRQQLYDKVPKVQNSREKLLLKCEGLLDRKLSSTTQKNQAVVSDYPKERGYTYTNVQQLPGRMQQLPGRISTSKTIIPTKSTVLQLKQRQSFVKSRIQDQPQSTNGKVSKLRAYSEKRTNKVQESPAKRQGSYLKPKIYEINQQNALAKEKAFGVISMGNRYVPKSKNRVLYLALS